ncbi:MAG: YbhB/YbcL family Raf kinase inhibitor-like protein [Isosphaeraceae bacterium]
MGVRRTLSELTGCHVSTWAVAVVLAGCTTGCGRNEPEPARGGPSRATIAIRSVAFEEGGAIPGEFTCDGTDRSPPLEWSGVPDSARELALLVDDPDAPGGTFTHWVVVGLPPGSMGVGPGVPPEANLPAGSLIGADTAVPGKTARQGKNDFGKVGYGGPCPPGGTHRYRFRLFALDATIPAGETALTRAELVKAMEGHIVAEGTLTGKYTRSR